MRLIPIVAATMLLAAPVWAQTAPEPKPAAVNRTPPLRHKNKAHYDSEWHEGAF
jgi:hypothetical protein